jgi:predicted AAA+ superfamily ATPase
MTLCQLNLHKGSQHVRQIHLSIAEAYLLLHEVTVITGMRRVGKTTIQHLITKTLEQQILYR